tara:strand:- start:19028 stop:19588 length:561 start_codon:yes stop_codon:yes gene_type:complete
MSWAELFGYTKATSETEVASEESPEDKDRPNIVIPNVQSDNPSTKRLIRCAGCKRCFRSYHFREEHYQDCKLYQSLTNGDKFTCRWCDDLFDTERGRNIHVHLCLRNPNVIISKRAHIERSRYATMTECLGCGKNVRRTILYYHTSRCATYQALTINDKYKCPYCNNLFDNKNQRARHYNKCKNQR